VSKIKQGYINAPLKVSLFTVYYKWEIIEKERNISRASRSLKLIFYTSKFSLLHACIDTMESCAWEAGVPLTS